MSRRLQNMPVVRAYVVLLTIGATPVVILSFIVWRQLGAAAGDFDSFAGSFDPEAANAVPGLTNLTPWWIGATLVIVVVAVTLLKAVLIGPSEEVTAKLLADSRAVAGGDLRIESKARFENEYGQMQTSLGDLIDSFRVTVEMIDGAASELKLAATEMAWTSDESGRAIGEVAGAISAISEGAAHQAELVDQALTVVTAIEGKVRDAIEHAAETQRRSSETEQLSEQGLESVVEVQNAMQEVRESSQQTAGVVHLLGEKSADIDQIVQAIAGIATQTNMLALNASIEAARAGDQGRGFANVAEEVRVLAEDAQHSAEQIAGLVREIQVQTEQAGQAMIEGIERVENGFETVNRNRQTFFDIGSAVRDLRESSNGISELTEGIASGAGQARSQIEQVAGVAGQSSASTEQVTASTEQTAAAAEEVSASAQRVEQTAASLAELAGRFQLPDAQEDRR